MVEEEWLVTLSTIEPSDLEYEDFVECARKITPTLREKVNYIHTFMLTVSSR